LKKRASQKGQNRVRQIIHQYAAGIEKRVYPHPFRHQIITFLTRKGIISPKLRLALASISFFTSSV
jgi:site-specific recombinase XerD